MSKEFNSGAESILDLKKKLTENGGLCARCKKKIGEVYEIPMERIGDKKLETPEFDLEL